MKITSLGHTECLVEIPLQNGATWRLMIDGWYSSFSPADCAERTPQVAFDWEKLPEIDVLFVSHSHMDHLDPYFLTEFYRHQSPLLLLAETLAYLVPTIREFLPEGTRIELLKHLRTQTFEGEVELTGIVYVEDKISNEDDVMTLFVSHGKDAAYFEIDMIPPMIYEEQQKLLDLFESKKFKNRIYVHSTNELEGNLRLFDFPNTKAREGWRKEYVAMRKEEILERYATCVEHELPFANLWKLPGYRSLFIGQGLQYPVRFSPALARNKIF
jgi:ribonuclease BN (tRNA processing enzyme)